MIQALHDEIEVISGAEMRKAFPKRIFPLQEEFEEFLHGPEMKIVYTVKKAYMYGSHPMKALDVHYTKTKIPL